jgi:hypothetical protein
MSFIFRVVYILFMVFMWLLFMICIGPFFLLMSFLTSGGSWTKFKQEIIPLTSPMVFLKRNGPQL